MWCIGFCYRGTSIRNDANESSVEYVEAQYKVPLQQMFNDILNLLTIGEIEYQDALHYYDQATEQIREDCDTCDHSAELAKLRDFVQEAYEGSL